MIQFSDQHVGNEKTSCVSGGRTGHGGTTSPLFTSDLNVPRESGASGRDAKGREKHRYLTTRAREGRGPAASTVV